MGCWNHTCALSNLPVLGGEHVYVFLLLEAPPFEKYVGSHCYASTYYNCLPFFFEGKYNDYGAIKNCHGKLLDSLIIPTIQAKLFEMEEGENESHDIAVTKKGFSIETLFNADHENRLFLNAWERFGYKQIIMPARLTHIVIKKRVLDSLLKNYSFQSYSSIVPSKNSDSEYNFEDLLQSGYSFLEDRAIKSTSQLENTYFAKMVLGNQEARWQTIFSLSRIIEDNVGTTLTEIMRQLAIYQILENFMQDSRRVWIKPSGVGSQEVETKAQELMATIVLKEAVKFKKTLDQ